MSNLPNSARLLSVPAIRHFSTLPPPSPPRSRIAMPGFLIGALAGVGAIGVAGYAWFHMSGAKAIVDKAKATKVRYDDAKEAVVRNREAAREKAMAVTAAAKDKSTNLGQRWKESFLADRAKNDTDITAESGRSVKEN
ncbi:hypothetical protein BD414DRAFT_482538 [Trametes punicea]|nr:hypothetical protein BD414DRAFT_482538 [Trametes punicea]